MRMELNILADHEIHLETRKTEEEEESAANDNVSDNAFKDSAYASANNSSTANTYVVSGATRTDKLPQTMAVVAVNLMVFAAGTLLTWSSPASPMLQKDDSPFRITVQEASWVGSLLPLGSVFGGPPFGWLVNRVGRKLTILSLAVPITIGWILILSTKSVIWLYIARFVCGFSLGGVSFVIPIYVAEVAEPSVRGPLSAITQVGFNMGILYSYAVGSMGNYTLLNLACLIVPIVFVILFVWMPEAPQYQLSKNDPAGAAKSLQWLRGKESNIEPELQKLKEAAEENARDTASWRDLMDPVSKKALIISNGLVAAQQLGGICVVLFYTETIFQASGSSMSSSVSSVVVGVVMLIFSFITMPIVDRLGRRILLIVSSLLEMLSLAVLGLYFLLKEELHKDVSGLSWLPLLSLIVYISAYCLGLGPLPWVVMSEVLPPKVKGIAGAIVASFCWITSFLITNSFQYAIDFVGRYCAFWFCAVMCMISAIFVFYKVPETKGISLQEIQEQLAGGKTRSPNGLAP